MKPMTSTEIGFLKTICIDFPVVQFYLIYDDDGSICLEHKIFISTDKILHLYNTTPNFYRWVFVESINTPDWNLNTVMPPKTMIVVNEDYTNGTIKRIT